MGYYMAAGRGDYYRGGRGDLLGIGKRLLGGAVGYITGGPLGAARGLFGPTGTESAPGAPGVGSTSVSIQPPMIGGARLGPSFTFEKTTGYSGSVDIPVSQDGGPPRGYHLNKAPNRVTGQPAGSYYVKNRHTNPTNPAALRRAIRREEGFISLARRFNLRPPPRQRAGSGLKTKKRTR